MKEPLIMSNRKRSKRQTQDWPAPSGFSIYKRILEMRNKCRRRWLKITRINWKIRLCSLVRMRRHFLEVKWCHSSLIRNRWSLHKCLSKCLKCLNFKPNFLNSSKCQMLAYQLSMICRTNNISIDKWLISKTKWPYYNNRQTTKPIWPVCKIS